MLSYECGVGQADQTRAITLMCTPGCTSAINSIMCKEAGITEEKVNRKSLCGDIDPKTKKPRKDSAQPIMCQNGLRTMCGIDTDVGAVCRLNISGCHPQRLKAPGFNPCAHKVKS
jgi:hypothetical protein